MPKEDLVATSQADGQILLIATTLEGMTEEFKQNMSTICEVLESTLIPAFKHANVENLLQRMIPQHIWRLAPYYLMVLVKLLDN